ncbi:MAG: hypothetical protein DWQ18_03850 [Crenarchaeota archaeon]|nr:MAG: hypothetical protein DWQ17_09280 [Thermoproteota archaeon]RDJ34348.1 MAG: hypothetical protein DWQ18_03850 [Thermoproteota archaeon]RDJ37189.1 MAG: hypothetical protein DWQ13_06765 [Thermoproteota archaeon]RDJ37930.1 MAG: hypothetical protein DWQ19_04070 [Thermoproteota archaeon]
MIVFSVMTGILLPVRLVFVEYVSDDWFGSFGIISAISVLMIVLIRKNKLGKFGVIFQRQIDKIQHGKKGKLVYAQSVFFLLILGGTIFAIEQGNSTYLDIKNSIETEHAEFSNPQELLEQTEQIQPHEWVYGIIGLFMAIFLAFPQVAAVFAVLNDTFDGWILHFYTVAFVEYLELIAILIGYRFAFKTKPDVSFQNSHH